MPKMTSTPTYGEILKFIFSENLHSDYHESCSVLKSEILFKKLHDFFISLH